MLLRNIKTNEIISVSNYVGTLILDPIEFVKFLKQLKQLNEPFNTFKTDCNGYSILKLDNIEISYGSIIRNEWIEIPDTIVSRILYGK